MMGMASLETLVRQVLPLVLPCPRGMVLDALRYAAGDFCEQTSVWRESVQEAGCRGESDIPLAPPRGARVVRVLAVLLDDCRLPDGDYAATGGHVCLRRPLPRDCAVSVEMVLRPSRLAEALPESLLERWGDVIAWGAQARLKAMSGKGVEWSDTGGAQIALEQYREGVARARIRGMALR